MKEMNRKSWKMNIAGLFVFLYVCFSPVSLLSESGPVLIKWALLVNTPGEREEKSVHSNEVSLSPDQTFQFVLQTGDQGFLYLFHYSSEYQLTPYLPRDTESLKKGPESNKWYCVPRERDIWFKLPPDHTGTEKFYLISSSGRLKALESLIGEYFDKPDDREVQKKLLDEVKTVIIENQSEDSIEEGVPISGLIKSEPAVIYEVRNTDFFAKIISITLNNEKNNQ